MAIDRVIGRGVDAPAEIDRVVERLLFELTQHRDEETLADAEEIECRIGVVHHRDPDGQREMNVGVAVAGQRELLEMVAALGLPGRLSRRLDRGQQQGDQHPDDADDDQQFDEREAPSDKAVP